MLLAALAVELDAFLVYQIARKIVLAGCVGLVNAAFLLIDQAARLAVGAPNSITAAAALDWHAGVNRAP